MGKTRNLYKKIRGTFYTKIGTVKERNDMDLTDAENIKKRWQEYTEELFKKVLVTHNHDGAMAHLEPDILECKVKWSLGSVTKTNLLEVMEFQLSYLKSKKMMLLKCCIQYASKFGKLSSSRRIGKCSFSFQLQRRAMPRSVQTTIQVCLFPMLVRLCSKSLELGSNSM